MELSDAYKEELTACLAEECGELVQACMKMLRFGEVGQLPTDSNVRDIAREAGDVICLIDIAIKEGFISQYDVDIASLRKRTSLRKWSNLITEEELGV